MRVRENGPAIVLPMETTLRKLELAQSDLQGHNPDALRCNQCGGCFCGLRVGRILDGQPLIMCSNKPEVQQILASLSRR